MFKYLESVATDIVTELDKCANEMKDDIKTYEDEANKAETKADTNIKEAETKENTRYTKTITTEYTDSEGNTHTTTETVEDTDEKARAMQDAAKLRAEAIKLRLQAKVLRGVVAFLKNAEADLRSRSKYFSTAIETSNKAIDETTNLLKNGASAVSLVLSVFYVPETKDFENWALGVGNNLLKIAGIDLSDGLNDEIYNAIGIATKYGTAACAQVIRTGVSYLYSQMGDEWYYEILKQGLSTVSEAIIDDVFNDNGAKLAQDAIASFLTTHGINALPTGKILDINADKTTFGGNNSTLSIDEAKELSKKKCAKYIGTLNCYNDEEKQHLIEKCNEAIDNMVVLSDEEFTKIDAGTGVVAFNNGNQDKVYIRESYANDPSVILHEVAGHGTGTMSTNAGYYYIDPETNADVLYTGNYADSTYKLSWKGNYSGIDEATTEYIARKFNGEIWEDCAYNGSTDALTRIINTMTKYGGVNADELLYQTYTGNDKELFKNKFNEMMENDEAYDKLSHWMQEANHGESASKVIVGMYARMFELKSATGV